MNVYYMSYIITIISEQSLVNRLKIINLIYCNDKIRFENGVTLKADF